jgi:hypothetical protein
VAHLLVKPMVRELCVAETFLGKLNATVER